MTPMAATILKILRDSPVPMGAYTIAAQLSHQLEKTAHANSVYRCITDLTRLGLVHQLASTKGFVAVSEGRAGPQIWLMCEECQRATGISGGDCHRALQQVMMRHRFVAHRTFVEVIGLCSSCQNERVHAA